MSGYLFIYLFIDLFVIYYWLPYLSSPPASINHLLFAGGNGVNVNVDC